MIHAHKVTMLVLAAALASCATKLTPGGAQIRSINESDRIESCNFLGAVTAKSPEFALTPAQEAEYVLNDARNKVAAQGGTHMKVITENHGLFTGATMNVEAYRCGERR